MTLMNVLKIQMDKAWLMISDLLVQGEYIAISRSSYDPTTGTVSQTSTITRTMVALVDYERGTRQGSDVESGDRRALIRASDLPGTPSPGDLLAVDGVTWTVIQVSGDARLFHDLQVRR
jgi:hypothetical protein